MTSRRQPSRRSQADAALVAEIHAAHAVSRGIYGAPRIHVDLAANVLSVTISLRRRPDGEPVPDDEYFLKVHPAQRQRMPPDAFVRRYGASQDDIDKVVAFANSNQLTVLETDAARRMVIVRGTVAQMNPAFAVDLGHYEHDVKTKL